MAKNSILIVDDNPVNLKLIRVLLTGEGYDVRTAADAEEAMQVLKESMRLFPPAYIVGRRATRPVDLLGLRVDRNDIVLVNVAGLHRRPEIFADPDRFDPDRFTAEREKALPRYAYLPFGAGPRVCIGNHFALMEGQILLATYAQHVRLDLEDPRDVGVEPLVTLRPKGHLRARVTPR